MRNYPCPPLPKTDQAFRIFVLHPSLRFQDPIHGTIFERTIPDSTLSATYDALSYVWGDEKVTSQITLNGQPFTVTTNLAIALRFLRKSDSGRLLWIDALCINQDNLEEKSRQVQRMWQIYETARNVVVWLGPHEGASEVVLSYIRSCNVDDGSDLPVKMVDIPESEADTFRAGWTNIATRSWFSRIWTLQEVAAAKSLQIMCGDIIMDGNAFCRGIVEAAKQNKISQQHFRKIRPAIELMGGSRLTFRPFNSPILALVERFRSWDAKKPVDKVYSLLGFSSDARHTSTIRPDYNITPHELAHRLVEFAFPSAAVRKSSNGSAVAFHVEGHILGTITKRTSDVDKKTFCFQQEAGARTIAYTVGTPSTASLTSPVSSSNVEEWKMDILNERELSVSSLVCLLRGALRPTVLRVEEGAFVVEMLATTEPYQDSLTYSCQSPPRSWNDVLEYYSQENGSAITFELEWDPFSQASIS